MSQVNNLTIQDIKWLLGDYNRIRNYGKVSNWIDDHVKCLQLLKGSWNKPGCSCEWSANARIASSVYEQHEEALKNRLAELEAPVIEEVVVKSRGRKKANGN